MPVTSDPDSEKPAWDGALVDIRPSLQTKGLLFAVPIAIVSAVLLFPQRAGIPDVGSGASFVMCLLAVYFILHQSREVEADDEQSVTVMLPAQSTTWRVVAVLTMMLLIPTGEVVRINLAMTAVVAALKLCQWLIVIEMVSARSLNLYRDQY